MIKQILKKYLLLAITIGAIGLSTTRVLASDTITIDKNGVKLMALWSQLNSINQCLGVTLTNTFISQNNKKNAINAYNQAIIKISNYIGQIVSENEKAINLAINSWMTAGVYYMLAYPDNDSFYLHKWNTYGSIVAQELISGINQVRATKGFDLLDSNKENFIYSTMSFITNQTSLQIPGYYNLYPSVLPSNGVPPYVESGLAYYYCTIVVGENASQLGATLAKYMQES